LSVLLVFVATLAALGFVALPFLRPPVAAAADDPARVALLEERDRAVAALKELELDHRAGTISDGDYRALVGRLRRKATEALRATSSRSDS
jgi:hypothetical protein